MRTMTALALAATLSLGTPALVMAQGTGAAKDTSAPKNAARCREDAGR